MKWFSFLVVAFVSLNLLLPCPALTESDTPSAPVVIQKISHSKDSEAQETITIKLTAAAQPKIFVLRGEKPRLVVDLPQAVFYGSNAIALEDGVLASTIRLGLHRTPVVKTRIVVDLAKDMMVQYTSDYQQDQNVLVLTLAVEATKAAEEKAPEAIVAAEKSMPELKGKSKKEFIAEQLVEKESLIEKTTPPEIMPPVKEQITAETQAADVPTILEISFDDSSAKGEMVLFRLNDFYPPTVAAIETDTPRVLCDFEGMEVGSKVEEHIKTEGKYIDRIRTARHVNPDKVRVVLDLNPDRDYDLQQVFYRNDNLFVLIVSELPQAEVEQQ